MKRILSKLFLMLPFLLTACGNKYELTLPQLIDEISHIENVNYYSVLNEQYTLSSSDNTMCDYYTYITTNYNDGYLYINYKILENNNSYEHKYLFYSIDNFAYVFHTSTNGIKRYQKYSAQNAVEAKEKSKQNIRNFYSVFNNSTELIVYNIVNNFGDDIENKTGLNVVSFKENGYLFVDYNYVIESTNIKFAYKKSISFDTHYRLSKFQYGFKNVTNNEVLNESKIPYLYCLDMTYTANYDFKNVNMNEYEEGDIFYYPASSEVPH